MGRLRAAGRVLSGWLLLRNADAGSDDASVVERAAEDLPGDAVVLATQDDEELAAALQRAADEERTPVVCGGDGSVSLAVATARRLGLLDELVLGLLPLGTGNDLAHTLGVPLDPEEAVAALADATPRAVDLVVGDDGTVVVNAVHLGVGVDAAERAEALKPGLGPVAYPLGAVAAGVDVVPLDVAVEVDGERVDLGTPVLFVAVANGRTIGGGHPVAPDADPCDGLLDVVVSHATGPVARVAYANALRSGAHVERDDVVTRQGRRVVVRAVETIEVDRDGELEQGGGTRRTWDVEPGAWRVLA